MWCLAGGSKTPWWPSKGLQPSLSWLLSLVPNLPSREETPQCSHPPLWLSANDGLTPPWNCEHFLLSIASVGAVWSQWCRHNTPVSTLCVLVTFCLNIFVSCHVLLTVDTTSSLPPPHHHLPHLGILLSYGPRGHECDKPSQMLLHIRGKLLTSVMDYPKAEWASGKQNT